MLKSHLPAAASLPGGEWDQWQMAGTCLWSVIAMPHNGFGDIRQAINCIGQLCSHEKGDDFAVGEHFAGCDLWPVSQWFHTVFLQVVAWTYQINSSGSSVLPKPLQQGAPIVYFFKGFVCAQILSCGLSKNSRAFKILSSHLKGTERNTETLLDAYYKVVIVTYFNSHRNFRIYTTMGIWPALAAVVISKVTIFWNILIAYSKGQFTQSAGSDSKALFSEWTTSCCRWAEFTSFPILGV